MGKFIFYWLLLLIYLIITTTNAADKTLDLECMFLGYPDLEYDGFDRTEVIELIKILILKVLTEKNFNKTCFVDDVKSIVFFNDVEEDDNEYDQYECFLQVC